MAQLNFDVGEAASPVEELTLRLTGTIQMDEALQMDDPIEIHIESNGTAVASATGRVNQIAFVEKTDDYDGHTERRHVAKLDTDA